MSVLITGASGELGRALVGRVDDPVGLVHSASIGGIRTVRGDVREPALGLTSGILASLDDVQCIVHCAATTDFGLDDTAYETLNVRGTAHAIGVARDLDVPLVYVSTAYVCGMRGGTVREDELDVGQAFGNGYESSKLRAETLVHAAAAHGLRAAIVRPSIVVGDSRDGSIGTYKNLYPILKLVVEGRLQTLPGRYDAKLSLVPIDYVADALASVVRQIDQAVGRTHHLVGADDISLRQLSDIFAEYPPFFIARYVPPSAFAVADLPAVERGYYRRFGEMYASYFNRRVTFDATNTDALVERPRPGTGPDYLRLLIDHCLESGYLGGRPAGVEPR
ncbi:SDR family oxidoreductase [Micromonospora sp. DT81.3]|uniref:SDR family oxidoreductase n=1 Tax=Micromonospora sp. DT81.3 TaxID=3416523 RepID=UPI003CF4C901